VLRPLLRLPQRLLLLALLPMLLRRGRDCHDRDCHDREPVSRLVAVSGEG